VRSAGAILVAGMLAAACSPTPDAGPFFGKEAVIQAINLAYEPVEITLPAGFPLRIVLDNRDSGVPHDVKVLQGDREIAHSPIVTGPATTEVRFGPLAPARYPFMCTVHPTMLGTLIVTP
jgi:plastocyanin